jgi:hypothetical protein
MDAILDFRVDHPPKTQYRGPRLEFLTHMGGYDNMHDS